jgi:hypothetical protein
MKKNSRFAAVAARVTLDIRMMRRDSLCAVIAMKGWMRNQPFFHLSWGWTQSSTKRMHMRQGHMLASTGKRPGFRILHILLQQ